MKCNILIELGAFNDCAEKADEIWEKIKSQNG